ncbi:hypothetical protein MAQ58_22415, partial [Enterobacter sp. DRP3]|nr:hypothetical protein [Enterobacter sp. DRP3]
MTRYRGMRRSVSPSGFLHGHAFYWRMDARFRLSRSTPERTSICRKTTRARCDLTQNLMCRSPRCCAQVRRAMPVVAGRARIALPQSAARPAGRG